MLWNQMDEVITLPFLIAPKLLSIDFKVFPAAAGRAPFYFWPIKQSVIGDADCIGASLRRPLSPNTAWK
jgi:hypothetical protein